MPTMPFTQCDHIESGVPVETKRRKRIIRNQVSVNVDGDGNEASVDFCPGARAKHVMMTDFAGARLNVAPHKSPLRPSGHTLLLTGYKPISLSPSLYLGPKRQAGRQAMWVIRNEQGQSFASSSSSSAAPPPPPSSPLLKVSSHSHSKGPMRALGESATWHREETPLLDDIGLFFRLYDGPRRHRPYFLLLLPPLPKKPRRLRR